MLKIWIDITTPKQIMYFKRLIELLETKGYEVLVTSRHYYEINRMLDLYRVKAHIIGRHGGKTLKGKLNATLDRAKELVEFISKENPNLLISLTSDVAARVAFGLGIPQIVSTDTPWAFAVNKLSIPYANKLFVPKATNYKDWQPFGVLPEDIIYYDAVDAAAWIKYLKPNPKVLEELGLFRGDIFAVLRAEETQAAYVLNMDIKEPVIYPTIRAILKNFPDVKIVALPRYKEHKILFRKDFGDKIIVPDYPIDVPSLLSFASLEMGFGGTITQEAALLGVPAISCYFGDLWCDEYLQKKGLLYKANSPDDAAAISVEILKNRDKYLKNHKELAQKIIREMDDPIEKLADLAINFLSK